MKQLLNQMKRLNPTSLKDRVSEPSVAASLLIPARHAGHSLEGTVEKARLAMSLYFPKDSGSYEIILIPNPRPGDLQDQSQEIAEQLASKYPGEVKSILHTYPQGKGAALQTGFLHSCGQMIFFTDADLPYDLEFIEKAKTLLHQGNDLITGNRRLDTSHFDIPVELLPIAYGRHRLGLAFNSVVRALFPIRTSDTQAGIKALSRRLASKAFQKQICPGFFFDLEIFLTAFHSSYLITEIPVTLSLNTEKSTVRLVREAFLAVFWLLRLAIRNQMGAYGNSSPDTLF